MPAEHKNGSVSNYEPSCSSEYTLHKNLNKMFLANTS